MFDDKEFDSPVGRTFLAKYQDQWLQERKIVFDEAEILLVKALGRFKKEFGTGDVFNKSADICVDIFKDLYNDKLYLIDKKYCNIYLSMKE